MAAVVTWNGSSSGLWSSPPNWSPSLPLPLTDDELVFPADGLNKDINNNLGGSVGLSRMTFSGAGYSLSGAQINLSTTAGNAPQISATHSSGISTVGLAVQLLQNATFSCASSGTLRFSTPALAPVGLGNFTLLFNSNGLIEMNSPISGAGGIAVAGSGIVRLIPDQPFQGAVALTGGTLIVNGTLNTQQSVTGAAASMLGGTGTLSGNLSSSGVIAPGDGGVGRFSVKGSFQFGNVTTSKLRLELGSPTDGGTTYDQLNCFGSAALGSNATLELTALSTFNPAPGSVYTLINQSGSALMTGSFRGLPQGQIIKVGTKNLLISYTGGTGNDLTATVVGMDAIITSFNTAPAVGGRRITATVSGGAGAAGGKLLWQTSTTLSGWTTLTSVFADGSGNAVIDFLDPSPGDRHFYRGNFE